MPNDEQRIAGGGGRVLSIDALRGFDMFWIIGGGATLDKLVRVHRNPVTIWLEHQLEHVAWEGFHVEDLIYPLFLFIVGLVLPFSLAKRRERGEGRGRLLMHILKRSVLLIVLGLIYNGLMDFNWQQMRWPGVLQRIGLCYGLAALLVVHTRWRTQAIVAGAVLLLYWAVVMLVPVPGHGAGVVTAEGCLPGYLDRTLIPGTFCCYEYGDNEGLLSTFPAVCTVLIGALAGHWLRSGRTGNRKAAGLALAGVGLLGVGWLWGLAFPIIKVIWTSSYTLFAGGWSLLLLAVFYWVIDVKGYKRWTFFFVVIGVNPITIYFTQQFVDFEGISSFFLSGVAKNAGAVAPLVVPFGGLMASWLFLWLLYRHKIFFQL
jgi:predicted acyltransferase